MNLHLVVVATAACLASSVLAQRDQAVWTGDVEQALTRAASERRVIVLALGEVGEGRSARHLKSLYPSKLLKPCLEATINVPAWTFSPDEARGLPRFDGVTAQNHLGNVEKIRARWIGPNGAGVIARPQHVWLSPKGEVLLSCAYEIDASEFAWCTNEALRRADIKERPALPDGAHPPRRLLMAETHRVPDVDKFGCGLEPAEIAPMLKKLKKRFVGIGDRNDISRLLFTDDKKAATFMEQQFGLWEMGGQRTGFIVDVAVGLAGLLSPESFLDIFENAAGSDRRNRRTQAAVAFEQLGSAKGLSAVKKAWKKEKDDKVRAEWARALGACGRGNKSVAKLLIRAAEKDKDDRVRRNAILGLGHVLPEPSARAFLEETVSYGRDLQRDSAILALALGRSTASRSIIEAVKDRDLDATTIGAIEAALLVLGGGNLSGIEGEVARVSESEVARLRLFFR